MKELGENELKLHYETGEYAKSKADAVIAVGPLAQELAKGADGEWFDSVEQLKNAIPALINEGDTVLVKASHSMHFEEIVAFLKEIFA